MKKLLMCALLFAFTVPLVNAEVLITNPYAKRLELVKLVAQGDQLPLLEHLKELPQPSQRLVAGFLGDLSESIQKTKLKETVLPKGVEDAAAIDAILPFITGVEQEYYALAGKDAQATQFVGGLLYKARFEVKDGTFNIPDFVVKYRSYIQTRTDLDSFYNDILKDAEAYRK